MKKQPQTWEELRTRLVAQMQRRSITYSDVARELGQRVQRPGEWLREGTQPRADITLQLLTYLEKLESSR